MGAKFLGTSLRRWLEYLIAILLGNAIYYFSLQPHLPPIWRHPSAKIDLGLFLDFMVCVGVYGLIRLGIYVQRERPDDDGSTDAQGRTG
jgi:hypothetical protein